MNELITSLNLNAVGTLCMFINIDGNNGHNTYIYATATVFRNKSRQLNVNRPS